MEKMRLGRTNLRVGRTAFGALPIQRVSFQEAGALLRKAYENGIDFFDTARGYSDSEEKIGLALSDVREEIVIATKAGAKDKEALFRNLETSLDNLQTDYVDILQLHNPRELPDAEDPNGAYQAMLEAKRQGKVRFVGITSHRLKVAVDAAKSEGYDIVQFPLCSLSSGEDLAIIEECKKHDIGLVAMKAMSGGLLTNAASAFAFLRQYENVLPIWGIQRQVELDEFLALENSPPVLDDGLWEVIEKDRTELSGAFCRGCGYCLPCPAEIPINMAARMSLLLRRAPSKFFLTEQWNERMERISECQDCRQCLERCPYNLDVQGLLNRELEYYRQFRETHSA